MKAHALALLPALFASVAAWAAPRETVSLDGAWEVRIDPADDAAKAHPKEAQWFPARVPGSVQQDLIAAGRVPDPFKGINEARIQWAGLTNWQFRRIIEVTPAMLARDHVELVFDGLDTFATVSINGHVVLSANNAHLRWRINAKPYLQPGANAIVVAIAGNAPEKLNRAGAVFGSGNGKLATTIGLIVLSPAAAMQRALITSSP